jgi:MYXO-CTERM domain-containing protein
MEAAYVEGDVGPRTLSNDDVAAVCAAYPPDDPRDRPCEETPVGGFSDTCGGGVLADGGCGCAVPQGGTRGLVAALLAAGLALTRTARRRRGV